MAVASCGAHDEDDEEDDYGDESAAAAAAAAVRSVSYMQRPGYLARTNKVDAAECSASAAAPAAKNMQQSSADVSGTVGAAREVS